MNYKPDIVTMQVLRYKMEQIADEMGYTLVRTSRSTIIKEIMDITCAVFDANGKTIAQAHHAPMLLTGFEITMKEILNRFKESDWTPGISLFQTTHISEVSILWTYRHLHLSIIKTK